MDELIDRLVAQVGIDRSTAEKAVGIILGFLRSEGPADKVDALLARLPGSEQLISEHDTGGGLAGMLGGGVMAVGTKLMSAGLGMGEIKSVAGEILAFGREKAGSETVDDIVASIPGLSQFV